MSNTSRSVNAMFHLAAADAQPHSPEVSALHVVGPLHASQGAALRDLVRGRLRRGERTIVLSLAGVSEIDAAGMGELVRTYNMTVAAAGVLRVADATGRVRELLDRVGLLRLLTKQANVTERSSE